MKWRAMARDLIPQSLLPNREDASLETISDESLRYYMVRIVETLRKRLDRAGRTGKVPSQAAADAFSAAAAPTNVPWDADQDGPLFNEADGLDNETWVTVPVDTGTATAGSC